MIQLKESNGASLVFIQVNVFHHKNYCCEKIVPSFLSSLMCNIYLENRRCVSSVSKKAWCDKIDAGVGFRMIANRSEKVTSCHCLLDL